MKLHHLLPAALCGLTAACAFAAPPESDVPTTPDVRRAVPVAPAAGEPEVSAVEPKEPEHRPSPSARTTKQIRFSRCNVDGPYVAMTFDDGPHGANTPRLLEMLKQRGIKATFFVCGECVAQYPELAKRIVDEGHEIANHSWSHPQLSRMNESSVTSQLQRTHDVIRQTTGVEATVMRPPYGAFTKNQIAWANRRWGYDIILWDVDPLDWKYRNAAHVESEILKQARPGSIILSHDIHKTTIDAMPATLDALLGKGFKFVTVSELIAMDRPETPKPKSPATSRSAVDISGAATIAREPVSSAKTTE
ncbi:MAG: polysaccharide deacetylase family protein [Chthoniobacteraceae bacterium]